MFFGHKSYVMFNFYFVIYQVYVICELNVVLFWKLYSSEEGIVDIFFSFCRNAGTKIYLLLAEQRHRRELEVHGSIV